MNIFVKTVNCECCSCVIDKSKQFQYIFHDNETKSDIQKLIFDCIGKIVKFNVKNQQLICSPCLQQLNQIKNFKRKCLESLDNNIVEEYCEIVSSDHEERPCSESYSLLDECEDYEVLEDFLDDDINVTPLKYLEQIEYESIEETFKNIVFESMVLCSICESSLKSHTSLIKHIIENHVDFDSADSLYYPCNLQKICSRFSSLQETNEHILEVHYSTSQKKEYINNLKCLTCNIKYIDKADFGKHICVDYNHHELRCSICSVEFKSRFKMNFHSQFHLENARPKICLICLIKFNTEIDFYNHVMFFHESSNIYVCSYCDQTFPSNLMRQNHEKTHDINLQRHCQICNKPVLSQQINEHANCHLKSKPFKCNVCGKQLNRASRLRKHIASHEQPKFNTIFSCELCDLSYAAKNHAIEHIKSIHNIDQDEVSELCSQTITDHVFCCEYCSKLYRTSKYLNEHRKLHDCIVQPYECEYCSATYDSFSKLRTHKIAHEKHKNDRNQFPVQKLFLCRHSCDKSYLHWPDLSHHMNTVHLAKPVTCEICNKSFPYRWNYIYHKKIEHTRKVIFVCNMKGCTAEFPQKKDYIIHKKQNHSEVKVRKTCRKCKTIINTSQLHQCYVEEVTNCELCAKTFRTINALKIHIKVVHDRIINYHCEFCNRGFYNISDKNIHLRIHTQEKPYQCSICSYECRTQSTLTEHMRTHTNDRPFSCTYPGCGSTFRRSYAMKAHFKIHSGEKNFKCTFGDCTKTFRSKSQLNYHLKKKHWNSNAGQTYTVSGDKLVFPATNENISKEYDIGCNLSNIIEF